MNACSMICLAFVETIASPSLDAKTGYCASSEHEGWFCGRLTQRDHVCMPQPACTQPVRTWGARRRPSLGALAVLLELGDQRIGGRHGIWGWAEPTRSPRASARSARKAITVFPFVG